MVENKLNVGKISEGFVLDHIEAGKSMEIYKYLHLDKLDCCCLLYTSTPEEFTAVLQSKPLPLSKAIYTSFTGISPITAEEICFIAGIDSSLPPKELSADIMQHLYNQFTLYFTNVKEGAFRLSLIHISLY